jgi:hypothetical protein
MPQMSARRRLIFHAGRAIANVNKTLEQLNNIATEAEGKNPEVNAGMPALALMGLTYVEILTKFKAVL